MGECRIKRTPSRMAWQVDHPRRSGRHAGLRHVANQHQRQQHGQEGDGVDEVYPVQPKRGDDDPAQRRADDRAGVECNRLHAEGIGVQLARNQVGDQGLPRGQIKSGRDGLDGGQQVDVPDLDVPGERQQAQDDGDQHHGGLGDEHHLAAVERVGHHAGDQRKRQDGHKTDQPNPADDDRLVRSAG